MPQEKVQQHLQFCFLAAYAWFSMSDSNSNTIGIKLFRCKANREIDAGEFGRWHKIKANIRRGLTLL